jgi:hypothetical protein
MPRAAEGLAVLTLARAGAPLNDADVDVLGRAAGGGGDLDGPRALQAAWYYTCANRKAEELIGRLGGNAPAAPAPTDARRSTSGKGASLRAAKAGATSSSNEGGSAANGYHDYMFFESSGPLRGFKRCLTEGGIRTAFAVSWPGTIAARSSSNYTVAFWDLLPTIAELGGVPASALPANIDGVSFAPTLLGRPEAQVAHPPLYWEFCTAAHPPGVSRKGVGWAHAMRNGTWKAVSFFSNAPLELYDLAVDVGETNNVAAAHPDVVAAVSLRRSARCALQTFCG